MSDANPDAQKDQDPDNLEAKIVADALKKVDADKEKAGSYYAAVPPEYKSRIDSLVDANFDTYAAQFGHDERLFQEAMSRNWLTKREAFTGLAEAAGMREVKSLAEVSSDPNDTRIAILTGSASYLLVGEGAFDKSGRGASVEYVRLPLRENAKISSFDIPTGGLFKEEPAVYFRARIQDKNTPDGSHDLKTSSVMSMFVLEDRLKPALKSQSVTDSFIDVDAQTITSFKLQAKN